MLVVVEVGDYGLYGLQVVLCVGYGLFCSLYSSLSLSIALQVEGSREGVEDGCLLCPLLYCGISPCKLGTPVRRKPIWGSDISVIKILEGINNIVFVPLN